MPSFNLSLLSLLLLFQHHVLYVSSASPPCNDPATTGRDPSCWSTLGVSQYLQNWTTQHYPPSTAARLPPDKIVCQASEFWSQCFLRIMDGQPYLSTAQDCLTLNSGSCKPPNMLPFGAEDWYIVFAIYAVHTYFNSWINAIQTVSRTSNVLMSAYNTSHGEITPHEGIAPDVVDLTFMQLVFLNGLTIQDRAVIQMIKKMRYNGEPRSSPVPTVPESEEQMSLLLSARLEFIMNDILANTTPAAENSPFIQVVDQGAFVYDVQAAKDIASVIARNGVT